MTNLVNGRINTIHDKKNELLQIFGGEGIKIPAGEYTFSEDISVWSNTETEISTQAYNIKKEMLPGETVLFTYPADVPFAFKAGVTITLTSAFVGMRM